MAYFTAFDGAEIAYQDIGRGRPLLLLHGLMAHSGFFGSQLPLSDEFRLIMMDFRGHGLSREAGPGATIEQLAGDVDALVTALDLNDVIGIGWSLGAAVLWRVLADDATGRFAGSVVIDMTPKVLNEGDWTLGLSPEVCEARSAGIRDDFEAFAIAAGQAMFAPPLTEAKRQLADWSGAEFARNDSAGMGALWSSLLEQDYRPVLPLIKVPAQIVHGAQSQLYGPETAQYLASALPNASIHSFEHSGHAPHLEEAELFNINIREFATTLSGARELQITP